MPNQKELVEELNFSSHTLSTQVRTIAFGALVFAWGLLAGESPSARSVAGQFGVHLILVGLLAIVTMFFDFIQYIAAYENARALYNEMNATHKEELDYDEKGRLFEVRFYLFYVKMASLAITVSLLLYVLVRWLVTSYR
jgi:hypothetical protein